MEEMNERIVHVYNEIKKLETYRDECRAINAWDEEDEEKHMRVLMMSFWRLYRRVGKQIEADRGVTREISQDIDLDENK